jgi:hypothetical protein
VSPPSASASSRSWRRTCSPASDGRQERATKCPGSATRASASDQVLPRLHDLHPADVDAAFLYPWALTFRELGVFGLVEMGVFMALLGGGFVYGWKSGALDW